MLKTISKWILAAVVLAYALPARAQVVESVPQFRAQLQGGPYATFPAELTTWIQNAGPLHNSFLAPAQINHDCGGQPWRAARVQDILTAFNAQPRNVAAARGHIHTLFARNNETWAYVAGYQPHPWVLREVARFWLVKNTATRDEQITPADRALWDLMVQVTQEKIMQYDMEWMQVAEHYGY